MPNTGIHYNKYGYTLCQMSSYDNMPNGLVPSKCWSIYRRQGTVLQRNKTMSAHCAEVMSKAYFNSNSSQYSTAFLFPECFVTLLECWLPNPTAFPCRYRAGLQWQRHHLFTCNKQQTRACNLNRVHTSLIHTRHTQKERNTHTHALPPSQVFCWSTLINSSISGSLWLNSS